MTEETIRQKLTERLTEITGIEGIKENSPFHELGIDSLILVELFVFVEKEFDVDLMASSISHEDIKTAGTLAAGIRETLGKR